MENLNLVELLKDVPAGTPLYSPICGNCELVGVITPGTEFCIGQYPASSTYAIKVRTKDNHEWSFTENGHYYDERGECLLFPSRDNRDWTTFKVKKEETIMVGDYIKEKGCNNIFRIKAQDHFDVTLIKILGDSPKVERIIDNDYDYKVRYEKIHKFDQSLLKPFDKVLVRNASDEVWFASFFSHIEDEDRHHYVIIDGYNFAFCIPYNDETKHIIGTKEDAPEFYRIQNQKK